MIMGLSTFNGGSVYIPACLRSLGVAILGPGLGDLDAVLQIFQPLDHVIERFGPHGDLRELELVPTSSSWWLDVHDRGFYMPPAHVSDTNAAWYPLSHIALSSMKTSAS
jgi:hypothetical protein